MCFRDCILIISGWSLSNGVETIASEALMIGKVPEKIELLVQLR